MNKIIVALVVIVFAWMLFTDPNITDLFKAESSSPKKDPYPGIVTIMPEQVKIKESIQHKVGNYTVHELYSFRINARILSKRNYSGGREADLSRTDFAMGWGNMSDVKILEAITIRQSNRWYHWETQDFPIPRREIETHSANMHLIAASPSIQTQIDKTQRGDIIEIVGSLVNVMSTKDDWLWKTSLTRTDTGVGSCEIIWVKELKIAGEPDQIN